MSFKDAQEFFDPPIVLPIRGKEYTLPEPDLELGLLITNVQLGKKNELTGKPIVELYKRILGPVWDEMLTDKVPGVLIARAAQTALADFQVGRDVAELVWETGTFDPESLAAQKAANQKKQTGSKRSTSSASARKTPSRASTRRTTSRPATPPGSGR